MRYKELSVSVSRKISQNYNSTDHTCGLTVELEETDDPAEVQEEIRTWCMNNIRKAFKPHGEGGETSK